MFLLMFAVLGAAMCSAASDRFLELAADIREAIALSGSMKSAALDMCVGPGQFSRELQGVGNLSARRLAELPDAFWQQFVIVRARRVGLPQSLSVAKQLERAL